MDPIKIDSSGLNNVLKTIMHDIKKLQETIEGMKNPNKEIISVTEACQTLSNSRSTVIRLFYSKKIRGYQEKHGGKIYLYRDSVLEYAGLEESN